MTDKAILDNFETIKQRFRTATEQNLELILELMTSNDELAQVLQDIHTLCDQGEFKPAIFVDFIGRQFMQYHRDYHQKLAPKRQ
jgi:hypothetical protein